MTHEWLVACLCAEWCGTCRDYRAVFEQAAHEGAPGVRFAWIDIEDHPEVTGDIDIENFPSLLIANGDKVAFFGTVTPHVSTLSNLVARATRDELGTVHDGEVGAMAARARQVRAD